MASKPSDVLIRMKAIGADMVARDAKKAGAAIAGAGRSSGAAARTMGRSERAVRQYERTFGAVAPAARGAGVEVERSSARASRASRGWRGLTDSIGRLNRTTGRTGGVFRSAAGGVAAFAGGVLSIRGIQGSVSTVTDLAKASLALQRNAGFDTETANRWASLLSTRGVAVKSITTSVVALGRTTQAGSKQIDAYRARLDNLRRKQAELAAQSPKDGAAAARLAAQRAKVESDIALATKRGAGTQAQALKQLGLTQADLQGSTEQTLLKLADGFKGLPKDVNRAALAQRLLGRSGVQLLPILNLGSDGIREQQALLEKYGAVISEKTPAQVAELINAEREWKAAQLGLRVQIGEVFLPVVQRLQEVLPGIARDIRDGNGAWSVLTTTLTGAGAALKAVVGFHGDHENVSKALLGVVVALTGAMVVHKVAMVAAGVATKAWSVATGVATAAQWLWNTAMAANPIGAIIVGVALLVAGVVLLYKRSEKFRGAVNAVWGALQSAFGWIRANWRKLLVILTGPIGAAVVVIAKHWDTITGAVRGALGWIRANWRKLLVILTGPIGAAVALVTRHWGALRSAAAAAFGAIRGAVQAVWTRVAGFIGFMRSLPGRIGGAARGAATAFVRGVAALPGAAAGLVGKLLGAVGRLATGLPARLGRGLVEMVKRLTDPSLVTDLADAAQDVGKAIINGIVEFIKSSPGRILAAIRSILPSGDDIVSNIGDAATRVPGRPGRVVVERPGHAPAGPDGQYTGGYIHRAGTYLTSERGPELVELPAGARVHSAPATRRILERGGGRMPIPAMASPGPLHATINLMLDGEVVYRAVHRVERARMERR